MVEHYTSNIIILVRIWDEIPLTMFIYTLGSFIQSSRNSIASNNNQSRDPSSKNSSRASSPGSGRSNNSSGWNN